MPFLRALVAYPITSSTITSGVCFFSTNADTSALIARMSVSSGVVIITAPMVPPNTMMAAVG